MRVLTKHLASIAGFGLATALAACQGNLGTGSGLNIPAAPANLAQGGPGQPVESRQRSLDGTVYLTSDMTEIPLPPLDGFAIALALGTPGPSPSPSATAAATGAGARGLKPQAHGMLARPSPSAHPSAAPSASPVPSPAASPVASAGASATASGAPSPNPSGSGNGPKIVTKTTTYPQDAPAAPSPQPSGNVQVFPDRKAIVRGFIQPANDIALYGLGAVRFTIPAAEQTSGRGFTIAVFTAGRKHRSNLIVSDTKPTLGGNVVASDRTDGLVLKKGTGYTLVLYGDELAATPGAVPSGYASPAVNPFVTPQPSGLPSAGAYGPATPVPHY